MPCWMVAVGVKLIAEKCESEGRAGGKAWFMVKQRMLITVYRAG